MSARRSKRIDFGPHDWHSMPVSGAQIWLVVSGLEPGTEYQFSVLAQNKLGTGPFSEVVTVTTAGGYCKSKVSQSMFGHTRKKLTELHHIMSDNYHLAWQEHTALW